MAELFKVNAPVRKPLFEGVQGENEARSIQFDITPWVEELGDGAVTATAKRSQDSQPYPVTVTKDGNVVTWKPTSTDTDYAGVGSFQLEYTVDSVLAKTCIWSTMVAPSLDPAGDPPDPYDNWLAEMRQIAADAIQAARVADESADDAQAEVYEAEAWAKGTKNGTPVSSSDAQYQNNSKYYSEESYKNAEAWAVGQRGGVDVPSTDPAYENNSKYWAEQSLANQYGAYIVKNASGDIASFSDGADDVPMKSVKVAIVPKQSGSGDPSPSNVRPITGWTTVNVIVSPTTTASDGTTTPVPLGQTVYGGEVNPSTGELKITHAYKTFGQLSWYLQSGDSTGNLFYAPILDAVDLNLIGYTGWCDKYACYVRGEEAGWWYRNMGDLKFIYSVSGISNQKRIYVRDNSYTDASSFASANANTQFVYELATPTTVQLTPTQVASLLGENNVWADCGSVEVEYRADPTLAYAELQALILENM